MRSAATRPHGCSASTLYVAFELGNTEWKLAMTTGFDQPPLVRTIAARGLAALDAEIARAKAHGGLPAHAPVRSCYEAGRDGFWVHRYLASRGIVNDIVDASSIEVNRRRRRATTDRLDACKLVPMLLRADAGERKVWSVVHVPSGAEEDRRHLHRELLFARRDRIRLTNRIRGLLATQGVHLEPLRELPTQLAAVRLWDGSALPPVLRARLAREWRMVASYTTRLRALQAEWRALLRTADDPALAQVRQLLALRGIGLESAWLSVMEFFAWRRFRHRRQVGGLAGLVATPYQSGDLQHERGISKAGNRYIRAFAINLAWAWLRYQPTSALTRWYQARFCARQRSGAQDRDRRCRAEAPDRALALSGDGACAGGSGAPSVASLGCGWEEPPAQAAGFVDICGPCVRWGRLRAALRPWTDTGLGARPWPTRIGGRCRAARPERRRSDQQQARRLVRNRTAKSRVVGLYPEL